MPVVGTSLSCYRILPAAVAIRSVDPLMQMSVCYVPAVPSGTCDPTGSVGVPQSWEPLLWSSGQRSRVRFAALPDVLRSSGCETWSTYSREDNGETT
jgi:hypothetical protein